MKHFVIFTLFMFISNPAYAANSRNSPAYYEALDRFDEAKRAKNWSELLSISKSWCLKGEDAFCARHGEAAALKYFDLIGSDCLNFNPRPARCLVRMQQGIPLLDEACRLDSFICSRAQFEKRMLATMQRSNSENAAPPAIFGRPETTNRTAPVAGHAASPRGNDSTAAGRASPATPAGIASNPAAINNSRVVGGNGKSGMHCASLVTVSKGDSRLSGGGRIIQNNCGQEIEILWCYVDTECSLDRGSQWTVQHGKSWPVSAEREMRWAACLGANTIKFERGSAGLRYICSAPLRGPQPKAQPKPPLKSGS